MSNLSLKADHRSQVKDVEQSSIPEIVSEEEVNKMIDVKLEKSNKEINKERLDKMLKRN